ncbi:DNA-directed RNA polymerases I and III subunit RPAC2 isoform X2 [Phycodurus eques]|uniref:DNA-directed RNA polymerases I and III subunit RPAC2 isoform X2 n=1 Tax=Phycodurus eques TaxID=693459 RepID=UPI002ACD2440|nr:DNA-directed RNA polymerases I and III subunit RPAC2 isoform X2 [Phycodurus eques]
MAAEGEKKCILEMVQADGSDEGSVTFVMHDEDHTLGNSLRYMIMKDESVEFCGYTITHPSESKINFRIQTRDGTPAVEPLRRGLTELRDVCQHVLNTFEFDGISSSVGKQPPCRPPLPFVRAAAWLVMTRSFLWNIRSLIQNVRKCSDLREIWGGLVGTSRHMLMYGKACFNAFQFIVGVL